MLNLNVECIGLVDLSFELFSPIQKVVVEEMHKQKQKQQSTESLWPASLHSSSQSTTAI